MKRLLACLLGAALLSGSALASEGKTYALVVKSTGNPYMTTMYEGFRLACEELGAQPVLAGPGESGAPGQPEAIEGLLADGVDGLAIAANNMDEISSVLGKAREGGVPVVSLDSIVRPVDRKVHIQQASPEIIGRVLIQACAQMLGGEGEFAILTTAETMPNQASWVAWMNRELEDHPEQYASMTLVETVYGLDEPAPSAEATQYLLDTYPKLKLIIAPTTVGLREAARVVADSGLPVQVTGLGLPSEMEKYIASGVCPWMYLWNPSEVGYLAAYAMDALVTGSVQGQPDEILSAGTLGDKIITQSEDGGSEIILGNPKVFDMTNIAVWGELF